MPFAFPERVDDRGQAISDPRLDFGIAISGGGVRSAAAAVGQLRGLQYNGWLERAGYISAVSGGAWAAVPFTYSKAPVNVLVGTMTKQRPCDLTLDGLKAATGSIAESVATTNLVPGGIREGIAFALSQNDDWIKGQLQSRVKFDFINGHYESARDAIRSRLFPKGTRQDKTYGRLLSPFFLDQLIEPVWTLAHDKQQGPLASARTFGWTASSIAEMSGGQAHGFPAEMLTVKDRPYLIVGSTMVVPGEESDDYPTLIPFEFTPLYSGSRVGRDGKAPGLYVSSWAIDTKEVAPAAAPDSFRAHLDPSDSFTLAEVIGATGAAPELTLLTTDKAPGKLKDIVRQGAKFFPALSTVAFDDDGTLSVAEPVSFGDGGFRDNLGLMPLLARGVHNILVFFNTNTPLSQMNDDVKSLFMKVDMPGGSGNKTGNVVFDAREYQSLYDRLLESEGRRGPQIYCKKGLEVKANDLYGIQPYSGLNLCIFYAADVQEWHDQLSPPVKSLFGSDVIKDNGLDQFPLYPTYNLSLKAEQVNLLANLWSWVLTRKETVDAITSTLTILPGATIEPCPVVRPGPASGPGR